jgi:hypothetical protein
MGTHCRICQRLWFHEPPVLASSFGRVSTDEHRRKGPDPRLRLSRRRIAAKTCELLVSVTEWSSRADPRRRVVRPENTEPVANTPSRTGDNENMNHALLCMQWIQYPRIWTCRCRSEPEMNRFHSPTRVKTSRSYVPASILPTLPWRRAVF